MFTFNPLHGLRQADGLTILFFQNARRCSSTKKLAETVPAPPHNVRQNKIIRLL